MTQPLDQTPETDSTLWIREACSHCEERPAIATRVRKDGQEVHTCFACLNVDEVDMLENS